MSGIASTVAAACVAAYFAGTLVAGLARQCRAAGANREAYGNFPVWSCTTHCAIGCCLVSALARRELKTAAIAGGLWLIKLASLCCTQECEAFANTRDVRDTEVFLAHMRAACPRAYLEVECWHAEKIKTRNLRGEEEERQVRRVSHRGRRYIQIVGHYDATPPLHVEVMKPVVFLKLGHNIQWLGRSMEIIEELRQAAYAENREKDENVTVTLRTEIDGLTENNYLKNGPIPCHINRLCIFLACFFCYDPLYLCYLRSSVPQASLVLEKRLTLEPGTPLPLDYDELAQQTRTSATPPTVLLQNTTPCVTAPEPQNAEVLEQTSVIGETPSAFVDAFAV